jgi:hypothetical protein
MKSQPRCRSPNVRSNVGTQQEQFLRDVRLTIESYDGGRARLSSGAGGQALWPPKVTPFSRF